MPIIQEGFNLANSTALTTSNTAFTNEFGAASKTADTGHSIEGTASARFDASANTGVLTIALPSITWVLGRVYIRVNAVPNNNTGFLYLNIGTGISLEVMSNGNVRLRTNNINRGTFTCPIGEWMRVDFWWTHETYFSAEFFVGTNLFGDVSDHFLETDVAVPAVGGVLALGPYFGSPTWTFWADGLHVNDWAEDGELPSLDPPDPPGPPTAVQFVEWDGTSLVPLEVVEWDGTDLQPLDVIETD